VLDATPVLVSPQVLTLAGLSTLAGAGAMWVASQAPAPAMVSAIPQYAVQCLLTVLLYVAVASLLPLQLFVSRALVKDVLHYSVAPRRMKVLAALAACSGTVLTATAYWQALSEMCALG